MVNDFSQARDVSCMHCSCSAALLFELYFNYLEHEHLPTMRAQAHSLSWTRSELWSEPGAEEATTLETKVLNNTVVTLGR